MDDDGTDAVDLLFDGSTFIESRTPRTGAGDRTHGTGCTFASALAAGLALGESLAAAAARAQQYVAGAIAHGIAVGHGARVLDHFWQTRSRRIAAETTLSRTAEPYQPTFADRRSAALHTRAGPLADLGILRVCRSWPSAPPRWS